MNPMTPGPQRIVCLTEETTEWLYLLGQEHRIVGISGYTVRPRRAREEKPKVSAFLSAKIDKILALEPDCIFGFSDLQADIAAALIRAGVQVTVFNQRSVAEIFAMLYQVGAMVGQAEQAIKRITQMQARNGTAGAFDLAAAVTGKHNGWAMHLFFDTACQNAHHAAMPIGVIEADTGRGMNIQLIQNRCRIGFHLCFHGAAGGIEAI